MQRSVADVIVPSLSSSAEGMIVTNASGVIPTSLLRICTNPIPVLSPDVHDPARHARIHHAGASHHRLQHRDHQHWASLPPVLPAAARLCPPPSRSHGEGCSSDSQEEWGGRRTARVAVVVGAGGAHIHSLPVDTALAAVRTHSRSQMVRRIVAVAAAERSAVAVMAVARDDHDFPSLFRGTSH